MSTRREDKDNNDDYNDDGDDNDENDADNDDGHIGNLTRTRPTWSPPRATGAFPPNSQPG